MTRWTVARAMKKKRRQEVHTSHERWLVSYADFITLLFAFFTTMYAISTVDARKLGAVVDSMQAAFANGDVPTPVRRGGGPGGGGSNLAPGPDVVMPPKPQVMSTSSAMTLGEVQSLLGSKLSKQLDDGTVQLYRDPRGLVVSLREAGAFATGSADPSITAQAVLAAIASSLSGVGNTVRVEGHTDDVPIHTDRFRSNWELSTARATNVVALLLANGMVPSRISAAGYGEFHPRVANDTEAGRAENRRVDVVILNAETARREEPGQAAAR